MQATAAEAIVSRGNSNSLRSQRRKTTAAAPSLLYGRMEANAALAQAEGKELMKVEGTLLWWYVFYLQH